MNGPITRRTFVVASASTAALAAAASAFLPRHARAGTLLSAFENMRGEQYVGGLSLATNRVFGARVPMRAHGCAIDPLNPGRVIFFARRPGTHAFAYDRATNRVHVVLETPQGRHLAGHGLFSPDGAWLFTPEHDYEHARGIIAVRDTRTFRVAAEIDTHGLDPHEAAWSPDHERLIVANGGIMTHPRSYRRKLNIATMDPSLCVIDATSGERIEQWRLPDHLLSIRHLAVDSSGNVAVGLQYEGETDAAPSVAALYRPSMGLELLPLSTVARAQAHAYVASVAVSETMDVIAAACPYGKGIACWSLHERVFLGFVPAAESYGVSRLEDGSILASQRDGTIYTLESSHSRSRTVTVDYSTPIRWDDHWTSVADL